MSINVTVNGSPVNIRRGKVLLCDSENLLKKEFDRRRILRLEQVRQQSKDIARKVRQKTEKEKDRQLSRFEQEQTEKQRRRKVQELASLHKKYEQCLQEIGRSHVVAASEPDADQVVEAQRKKDGEQAAERSRVAAEQLRQQQREDREQAEQVVRRQQCVRAVEQLRASLMRSLATRKDKQPLAEVSLNIQPASDTRKTLTHPVAHLGKSPATCSCSTARLCECLNKVLTKVSSQEDPCTASTGRDKTSSPSLFMLDSRVSLIPPGDERPHQEPSCRGPTTYPLTSTVGQPPSQQETCTRSTSDPASRHTQGDVTARSSQRTSSGAGHSATTAATKHAGSSVGHRTASSHVDHKVQFYDYSSRFEKEAEAQYTVRRHDTAEEGGRGSAMAAAQLEEAEQRDGDAGREELLCRQRERSHLALAREHLRQDYQRLLQRLPTFARANTARLPAVVHLEDERRQQRDALRQSNMASVFEKLQHSIMEMDEVTAPASHRASVTVSPQQTDDETPPKLNVGACTTVSGTDPMEHNLAAALENLRARLEQQRALLRAEECVHVEERAVFAGEEGRPVSSASNMSRKLCKKGKLHQSRQGTVSKQTSKVSVRAKENNYENKQEGVSKGQNAETVLKENSKNENMKGKPGNTLKDKCLERTREGRSDVCNQVGKQEIISKGKHHADRRRENSKNNNQECKQGSVLKYEHQEYNNEILKERKKGGKEEILKDSHQERDKSISRDTPHESNEENTFKNKNQQARYGNKPSDRYQESARDERLNDGKAEKIGAEKKKEHKLEQRNNSREREDKCKQKESFEERSKEDRRRCRSKDRKQASKVRDSSRDSSHEGSEITVVSEFSLDVSTSKLAELTQSSMNSSEKSSSSSMRVCEDIKLQLNVKEVIKSPCRTRDQPHTWKHVCKRSVDMKKCRKRKLYTVEEGTQTSILVDEGKPSAVIDSQAEKSVLESSDSTAYLSLPKPLAEEQAEMIDELLHVVQHKRSEVEDVLAGRKTNPTLLLYIARLLSMSRASVEDLSVVSTPTPQGTPCKCRDHEHDESSPPPQRPPEPNVPPLITGLSQSVCQTEPVASVTSTSASQEVIPPQVVLRPSHKPAQTIVTPVICQPKMSSLPTDLLADSCMSVPEVNTATSVLLPGHKSFNLHNSEDDNITLSQNDYSNSLLDVSLDIGLLNHCSSNGSGLENSLPSYSDFWDKYQTISRQYTERISGISAQIQSLREARMQLESSSSESDHTAVSSHIVMSTPLPPADTTATAAVAAPSVPGPATWSEALSGQASSQQRGRHQRQRPPPALDRNKLMAGSEVCGPSHELSTIVEVDTPQSSHIFASTTAAEQQHNYDSDDTLPDVAAELIRRGLITSSFWQAEVAPPSAVEEQHSPPSSEAQDLESALARLGMSWAGSTLRKVQQAEQLSSTSSEAASGTRRHSTPEDTRARSTPFMPASSVCFPNESDVSTVHQSPESVEIQAPGLSLRQTHIPGPDQGHYDRPPRN